MFKPILTLLLLLMTTAGAPFPPLAQLHFAQVQTLTGISINSQNHLNPESLHAQAETPKTIYRDVLTKRAIDPAKSKASFSVQHVFVQRVTGTIGILYGSGEFAPGSRIPIKVTALLDAAHVATGEPDRDHALEGPEYFDATAFPTWSFVSTDITAVSATSFKMDGLLTIHGVTQPEHLEVTVTGDAEHPIYHAIGHINRHAFGMKGSRLDPVIGDVADVALDISLK